MRGSSKTGMDKAKGYGKAKPGTGGPMLPPRGAGYKNGGMVKPKGKK